MKEIFNGVYDLGQGIGTQNFDIGKSVYKEKLIKSEGVEYRLWDPFRSKLCGAIKKGLKTFPFSKGSKILYLGASTGTTISHLSDIVKETGEIYAVEIAPQCMKSLIALCQKRENILPIHADAKKTSEYSEIGKVDIVYQDVAQPDQDDILIKNCEVFLKKEGIAMICIKSQSIDVTKEPKIVFEEVLKKLEKYFEILETHRLDPYDKDHLFAVLKYK